MPCGCGKKNTGTVHFMGQQGSDVPDPEEWGPILWKYLHSLAEKIGKTGNTIVDTDQAHYMEMLLNNLHLILPCPECQTHASAYITTTPLPSLRGLYGENLRSTVRNWLFTFHNHVRNMKGQPISLRSPEECIPIYSAAFIAKCEYTLFVQSVAYAARHSWVRIDNWRRWYSNSERLRIITGNVII
jgi:hypothetical protein